MSAHHETRATTARRGGRSVIPRAVPAAAPHSAHRPADRNGHGSAVSSGGNGRPPCLVAEDLPPRAAGARGAFPSRQEEAARLYAARWQPEEIAKRLGIRKETVYVYACRQRKIDAGLIKAYAGAPRQIDYSAVRRMARDGVPQVEIARRLKCATSSVSTVLRKLRDAGALVPAGRKHAPAIEWTPELTIRAARIAATQSTRAAAEAVGTTRKAVQQHFVRKKISIRRIRAQADQVAAERA